MNARVLIVEDEADLADLLAWNLEREHFQPEVALSGEAALERLARPPRVDVVDSAVKRLRKKLEPLGFTIAAVRGVGFRLEAVSEPPS